MILIAIPAALNRSRRRSGKISKTKGAESMRAPAFR
jgi:hypothetical protein